MTQEEEIKQRYVRIAGDLTERTRRLFAANEALSLGWGGISAVSRATGLSRQVISDGMQELQEGPQAEEGRVRRKGGGRKRNVSKDPKLSEDLERLVEPVTRGDPESPLVTGSTNRSKSSLSLGSLLTLLLRPPPLRRTRPSSAWGPSCSSCIPSLITCRDSPVARDTAEIPPQPSDNASLAANRRRVRSVRSPAIRT